MTSTNDVLERLNCATLRIRRDATVAEANTVARAWLGRGADLIGAPLASVLTKGSLIYWETSILPLLSTRGHAWDVALDLRGPDGDVPTLVNVAHDGQEVLCVLLRFDERRRYERAMAAAEATALRQEEQIRALREVAQLRQDFINSAAHELATPLTPIRLQLHLLRGTLGPDAPARALAALDTIEASTAKLTKFIRDLQTAADIQAGRVTATPQELDLVAEVRRIVDAWAAPRDVEVRLDAPPAVPAVPALADPDALERVLAEVLGNAAKFAQGKPITVTVAGPLIRIEDEGIGIDPTQIGRLGQPFAQLHDPRAFTGLGAGLGLHIAQALMAAQGGALAITSDGAGRGTQVTLRLSTTAEGAPDPADSTGPSVVAGPD